MSEDTATYTAREVRMIVDREVREHAVLAAHYENALTRIANQGGVPKTAEEFEQFAVSTARDALRQSHSLIPTGLKVSRWGEGLLGY